MNVEREFLGEMELSDFDFLTDWSWSLGADDINAAQYFDVIKEALFAIYNQSETGKNELPSEIDMSR